MMYNSKSDKEEEFFMLDERLRDEALRLAAAFEEGRLQLPAEIPGFEGIFLATPEDVGIRAMSVIKTSEGSYKIGPKKV